MRPTVEVSSIVGLHKSVHFLAMSTAFIANTFSVKRIILVTFVVPSKIGSAYRTTLLSFDFATCTLSKSKVPVRFALVLFVSRYSSN